MPNQYRSKYSAGPANADEDYEDDYESGGEEEGTFEAVGKNCKFECLIMTLYPCSPANWLIFITLFILLALLILPEELDLETNELVPDWTQALLFSILLYFPISFSYHFVTKYM